MSVSFLPARVATIAPAVFNSARKSGSSSPTIATREPAVMPILSRRDFGGSSSFFTNFPAASPSVSASAPPSYLTVTTPLRSAASRMAARGILARTSPRRISSSVSSSTFDSPDTGLPPAGVSRTSAVSSSPMISVPRQQCRRSRFRLPFTHKRPRLRRNHHPEYRGVD